MVTFTKVRENFAHTVAPGWGLEIKWQGIIKILQSAFLAACSKKFSPERAAPAVPLFIVLLAGF